MAFHRRRHLAARVALALLMVAGTSGFARSPAQEPASARPSAPTVLVVDAHRARHLALIRVELESQDFRRIANALYDAVQSGLKEIGAELPALIRRLSNAEPSTEKSSSPMQRRDRANQEAWNVAVALALDASIQFGAVLSDVELDAANLRWSIFE